MARFMDPLFRDLLILMIVIWSVAVLLRQLGLPTVMGELLMGVILGPAVLNWVEPSEIINVLAQLGMFFLMLHAGVNTKPQEFFSALHDLRRLAGAVFRFGQFVLAHRMHPRDA